METYIFNVDNNGMLHAKKKFDNQTYTYEFEDSINILHYIDNLKFKSFGTNKKGNLILKSNNVQIFIDDLISFCENNYFSYLENNGKKIKDAIDKVNRKKYQDNVIKMGFKKKIISMTSIGTAAILSISAVGLSEINKKYDDKVQEIIVEQFDANDLLEQLDRDEKQKDSEELEEKVILEEETIEIPNNIVNLEYNNEFDENKYHNVYDKYYDDVCEKSEKWGISSNLIIALMSQESGGNVTNLCQIEFDAWKDQKITCYNFKDNKYESIVLTDNKENYVNQNVQTISREEYLNPKTNISVACMILRYSYERLGGHIIASVQGYNYGVGVMMEILNEAAIQNNTSIEEILSDQNNTCFLENRFNNNIRKGKSYGDNKYVENVFQYLASENPEITFKYLDDQGNVKENTICINNTYSNELETNILRK